MSAEPGRVGSSIVTSTIKVGCVSKSSVTPAEIDIAVEQFEQAGTKAPKLRVFVPSALSVRQYVRTDLIDRCGSCQCHRHVKLLADDAERFGDACLASST